VKRQRESRRILIADDEDGFRDGVADLLEMEGYTVSVACDAAEAMRLLPQVEPDAILLDLHMPNLDGETFLRGMNGLLARKQVPVVLVSAKEDVAAIARRLGAAGALCKPFEAPQLLELLEQILP